MYRYIFVIKIQFHILFRIFAQTRVTRGVWLYESSVEQLLHVEKPRKRPSSTTGESQLGVLYVPCILKPLALQKPLVLRIKPSALITCSMWNSVLRFPDQSETQCRDSLCRVQLSVGNPYSELNPAQWLPAQSETQCRDSLCRVQLSAGNPYSELNPA